MIFQTMACRSDTVTLKVNITDPDTEEYSVLASVLAEHSDYFNGLFLSGMRDSEETTFYLPSLSDKGLAAVHWFLTRPPGDGPKLTTHNMEFILHAATYLQIQDMIDWIIAQIKESIDRSNCILLTHDMGLKYGILQMSDFAFHFMCDKFEQFSLTDEFLSLNEELLCNILSNDNTNVSREVECFTAMMRWFLHQVDNREISGEHSLDLIRRIISNVRFYLMENEEKFRDCHRYIHEKKPELDNKVTDYVTQIIDKNLLHCLDPLSIHKVEGNKRLRCAVNVLVATGGFTQAEKSTNKMQFISLAEICNAIKPAPEEESEGRSTNCGNSDGVKKSKNLVKDQSHANSCFCHGSQDGEDRRLTLHTGRRAGVKLPRASCEHSVGVVDGCVYIVGGQDKYSPVGKHTSDTVHRYNPYTHVWSEVS